MAYYATTKISVDVCGLRVEKLAGDPLDDIDSGQIEGMLHVGTAMESDEPPVVIDTKAEAEEPEVVQAETLASLGLSQAILSALKAEGIETVSDALEFLEDMPEGFSVIEGIGEASDKKIRAAIGVE